METIGTKISKIRKQKGMSQEELSDLSKINLRTLQRIEKDENEPRGNTLKQICEVLKINTEELLDYGKVEDNSYLIFLHLSIISNIVIPLGNIILPLILWLNKRNSIVEVNNQGKNIINFQIFFSIISNAILIIALLGKIMHLRLGIVSIFLVYYSFTFLNICYSIYVAIKIKGNRIKNYYPNPIKFLK